jgi:hypothetical protein
MANEPLLNHMSSSVDHYSEKGEEDVAPFPIFEQSFRPNNGASDDKAIRAMNDANLTILGESTNGATSFVNGIPEDGGVLAVILTVKDSVYVVTAMGSPGVDFGIVQGIHDSLAAFLDKA